MDVCFADFTERVLTLHFTPPYITLRPTPYTPRPTLHTLHPTPYTLHPTLYTLHPTPYSTPYTLHALIRCFAHALSGGFDGALLPYT